METCKNHRGTELINMEENLIYNQQKVAHPLNYYFVTLVDKIRSNMKMIKFH